MDLSLLKAMPFFRSSPQALPLLVSRDNIHLYAARPVLLAGQSHNSLLSIATCEEDHQEKHSYYFPSVGTGRVAEWNVCHGLFSRV